MITAWAKAMSSAHQHVRADELPAPQRRRGEPLEDELLAVGDERDGREDADLHERQAEDARHEVADRVEVLGLDVCGLGTTSGGRPPRLTTPRTRPDRLVDRARRADGRDGSV